MTLDLSTSPTALDIYNAAWRRHALDGDVAAARDGKGFFPAVVAGVTHMPQHHVGMLFWWGKNLMVIEATADGITCGLFSQWWNRQYGRIEIYRLKPEYQKAFDAVAALDSACADMRKVKYGFQGIGNLAIYKLFGIDQRSERAVLGPPDKGAANDSERGFNPSGAERRFCSASTARWTRHGGVPAFAKDDSLVIPGDYATSPFYELVVSLVGRDEPKTDTEAVEVNS